MACLLFRLRPNLVAPMGIYRWILSLFQIAFLLLGVVGSIFTLGLKERGRKLFIFSVSGTLLFYIIAGLPRSFAITFEEVLVYVFLVASFLFFNLTRVKNVFR
jgi:hypothetical protein